jgi:pimeloyl-ACP methyl ester carboxylesterase
LGPLTAYDVHRGGAGTPLVLLHGLNLSWRIWQPVIPLLEREHTVIAPTLAGHLGGPPLPAGPHGIAPVADAVEQLLDDAGLDRAHLVGNSLGGWLACELARRGRASSVVVFSPAGAWATQRDGRRVARLMRDGRARSAWPGAPRLLASPGLRRRLMKTALERGDRIPTEVAVAMLDDVRSCVLLDGLLGWLGRDGLTRPFDIDPSCAVRVAWAANDRTIPYLAYGRAFRRLLPPWSELVALRGVGHVPTYDDPELVARTVLQVTTRKNPR